MVIDLIQKMGWKVKTVQRGMRKEVRGICLVLQPQVELATGRVFAAEVLARRQLPGGGMQLPEAFVPAMEKDGGITALDQEVFRLACRLHHTWAGTPLGGLRLALNVYRRTLERPGFCRWAQATAKREGACPAALELEVTESALVARPARVLAQAAALRAAGFRLAVDDFGTGYSNLELLCRLEADMIKLDRSLVCAPGERAGKVIEAVARLAGQLGAGLICEGVETQRQAQALLRLGCRWGQGFLYARPLPPQEFFARYAQGACITVPDVV